MQVCHGRAPPLRRVRPGDTVVYYSPTERFQARETLQAFTAIGIVKDGDPYQVEMGEGFRPYRRDVRWLQAREVPIRQMLGLLEFTSGHRSWGYSLRFGLFEVSAHDVQTIAQAMGAAWPPRVSPQLACP